MTMKAQNPTLPILIRECQDTIPRMTVQHKFGREEVLICDGLTVGQIKERLNAMAMDQKQLSSQGSTASSFIGN